MKMDYNLHLLLLIFGLLVNLQYSLACDGFKMKFNKIENCGGKKQIVTIDSNFTTTINKKCEISSIGCVSSKGFTEAKMKYTVFKNGLQIMNGNPDMCSELENHKEAKGPLEMMGFPTACPIPKGRKCIDGSNKIDAARFKKYFNVAKGKVDVDAEVTHDTGTSCFKIEFEIYK